MSVGPPLAREHAFPLCIAAKAAVVNPPKWIPSSPSSQKWWHARGNDWLRKICESLDIQYESLPDEPTWQDTVGALSSTLPQELHPIIVAALLSLSLSQSPLSATNEPGTAGHQTLSYSASTRAFLCRTLQFLDIPYSSLTVAEKDISKELYERLKDADLKDKSEAMRKEKEHGWGGKWGRIAATAGGVVLGGVAIGLTGGLAAPALLPLLPFLSAGVAPAVIGSLFGLAGGGLTGYRVRRRWGGVEHFEFVEISGPSIGEGDKTLKQGRADKPPSLVAAMIIPGLQLDSINESLESSKRCFDVFAPTQQDFYLVSHSPEGMMLSTGKNIRSWVTTQLLSRAGKEVLQRTALNAAMVAVALPITIYKTTGMAVDNEWIRGCDKARKAGLLLADVLREKVQGNRPLILIGSSLGAITLFEALLSLASKKSEHDGPLIDTAVFISLPQAPSMAEWAKIRSVVARRVVNGYCKGDFVIASVGRLHEVLGGANVGSIAGLAKTSDKVIGVENVDLGQVIDGHFDLAEKMPQILQAIKVDV